MALNILWLNNISEGKKVRTFFKMSFNFRFLYKSTVIILRGKF